MIRSLSLALGLSIALSWTALAAAPEKEAVTLHLGDPAPALQVDKWLKGEPVKAFEPGKIYVIECWATWCGPCIASMPHVTKMQAKYKDQGVIVIGANVWERDKSAPEPFVKKMGDKMGYRVATDDLSGGAPGKMATTWLKAAGRNGIPCSFLVDRKGKIAWIGHPMEMERPLALLASDKFDPVAEEKFNKQMEGLSAEFSAAMKAKDNDKALATIDQIAALNPTLAPSYATTRLMILLRKEDYPAANALASSVANDASGDYESMAGPLASTLLGAKDLEKVDTKLAVQLATTAYEKNGNEGWQYQNLLARAYAANKQYPKAVELQKKALETIPAQIKEREQKTLAEYEAKAAAK